MDTQKEKKFEELSKLGVKHRTEERNGKLQLRSVFLHWTPEQWVDILNKEGKTLPMCCANLSAARDYFTGAIREGGWIDADDLYAACSYIFEHEGFEKVGKGDAFYWLQKVWHFLKGNESIIHLTGTREPVVLGYDRVKGEMKLKDAVNIIERGARNFWWSSAFDKKNCYTNYNAYATAAQMIPAVTALYKHLEKTFKDPYRGIALISPKTKRPYNTASGLAVYSTVEEAIQTLKFWKEDEKVAEPVDIYEVEVTVKEGFSLKTKLRSVGKEEKV